MSAAENTLSAAFRSKIEGAVKNKKLHPINAKRYRNFLNGNQSKYISRRGETRTRGDGQKPKLTLNYVESRLYRSRREDPDGGTSYYLPSSNAIKGQNNGKNVFLGGNNPTGAKLSNKDKSAFASMRAKAKNRRRAKKNAEGSSVASSVLSVNSSVYNSRYSPAVKRASQTNGNKFSVHTNPAAAGVPRKERAQERGVTSLTGNETRKKNEANNCIPIFGRATCAALDRGRARVESGLFGGSKRPPSHLVQGTGQKREVKK